MYLATSAEMKFLDRLAIVRFGLPGLVLMENAAQSTAGAALKFWPDWPDQAKVMVLGGPGQNGGDGWALARILSAKGFEVHGLLVKSDHKEVGGDAAVNLAVARNLGLKIATFGESGGELPRWADYDLIVDALFGTGLDRPLSGPAETVLKSVGQALASPGARLRVLAIDLPSGLSGDNGRLWGPPLKADLTVTLGAPKVGLYLGHGPRLAGKIVVGDIGLCPPMFELAPPLGRLSGPAEMRTFLPARPADGHKGVFGHVLLAGGARGKTGALVLAARGAARSGAALVTALHPTSLGGVFENKLTEVMTLDLPEDEGGELSAAAGDLILEYGPGRQALALGPGLGLSDGAALTVRKVVEAAPDLPLVLDADALTHLAGKLNLLKKVARVVLTPHPGEAARLLSVTSAEIQSDRLRSAREISRQSGAVVILKGFHSLIVEPEGRFFLNPTGGPHLSVGGSGDLLTGVVAGLLAQGLKPFKAAALAAWVHGRAGDLAAAQMGPFGLTPDDFALRLPEVWRELSA